LLSKSTLTAGSINTPPKISNKAPIILTVKLNNPYRINTIPKTDSNVGTISFFAINNTSKLLLEYNPI
jgi:hypothetical protein